ALCRPDRVNRLVLIASAPQGAPPHDIPPAVDALFSAVEDAEDKGDMAQVNELEANLWLDGPEAPRGRVGGEARQLFLDMNGRALHAPATGDEQPLTMDWTSLAEVAVPTLL